MTTAYRGAWLGQQSIYAGALARITSAPPGHLIKGKYFRGGGVFGAPDEPCCFFVHMSGVAGQDAIAFSHYDTIMLKHYGWPQVFNNKVIKAYDATADHESFARQLVAAIQPGTNLYLVAEALPAKPTAADVLEAVIAGSPYARSRNGLNNLKQLAAITAIREASTSTRRTRRAFINLFSGVALLLAMPWPN